MFIFHKHKVSNIPALFRAQYIVIGCQLWSARVGAARQHTRELMSTKQTRPWSIKQHPFFYLDVILFSMR